MWLDVDGHGVVLESHRGAGRGCHEPDRAFRWDQCLRLARRRKRLVLGAEWPRGARRRDPDPAHDGDTRATGLLIARALGPARRPSAPVTARAAGVPARVPDRDVALVEDVDQHPGQGRERVSRLSARPLATCAKSTENSDAFVGAITIAAAPGKVSIPRVPARRTENGRSPLVRRCHIESSGRHTPQQWRALFLSPFPRPTRVLTASPESNHVTTS